MKSFHLILLLFVSNMVTGHAQSDNVKKITLQELYGDFVPQKSEPLNILANLGLILPDTKLEDWPDIRGKILQRVKAGFGEGPVELMPAVNKFEEMGRYSNFGLIHIKYRYHVVDDIWNEAVVVLPEKFRDNGKSSAILVIHGTINSGKEAALGEPGGRRAYALELAKRGYVTLAPDLYGFGATIKNTNQAALVGGLMKKYPKWSYRGIKILSMIRAIDLLEQLPFVKKGAYGSMGNSLGGGMALYHTAFDQRIKVSVPSTGVSPANTNVFRLLNSGITWEEPEKWKKIAKDGKPPYDIHEVIALCAPRCMLFLEDYNDPYNPDVMASFQHIYQAMQVYQLLGTPGHISMLIHGDGHDTVDDVREYAYKWFDRYLLTKPK